jgi:hypothetical protein
MSKKGEIVGLISVVATFIGFLLANWYIKYIDSNNNKKLSYQYKTM